MSRKQICLIAAFLMLSTVAFAQNQGAEAPKPAPPQQIKTPLKVGDKAPDFTLTGVDGKVFKLSKLKGKNNVVLAFYPKAFTGG